MPALTETARIVVLNPVDNVAIAVRDLSESATVSAAGVSALRTTSAVPQGHKVALRPIATGQPVVKFGQTIGFATKAIAAGDWVHAHNLAMNDYQRDYAFAKETPPDPAPITGRTFMGYRRADGRVATRNYIGIIATVNCSNAVSKAIVREFSRQALRDFPNIDGVVAFTHATGCGMQYGGMHHQILNRVMAGFARHPNIAAYLVIGLGCEVATTGALAKAGNLVDLRIDIAGGNGSAQATGGAPEQSRSSMLAARHSPLAPVAMTMQDMGGTRKTIDRGIELVKEMLPAANRVTRVPIPASEIILATKCGGSDGNSGITANPALGVASDAIVACGGTSILGETTEIYGAEHLLTRRAKTQAVGMKLVEKIKWWEWYTGVFGASIDNNPSPGNKAGGLTTIYEKSLGAVAKGGTAPLSAVYDYAEQVAPHRGFVIMDSPGFDPAVVTGMVAGGANVICFTTGRGSCFGYKPVPSIKIATNTPMYERLIDDMDFNAGTILEGASVQQVGEAMFELILDVASGKKTKSEEMGLGDEEFVPWYLGPVV